MPSSQTLSALQEKGFRTTFRGFDKNDVLAYLNALDNENRQHSAEQEEQVWANALVLGLRTVVLVALSIARACRLPSCRPSWIKCALNSPLHVPVWKSCKAIFQPLTSAPKLRKNRLPRWSPVPNR